MAGKSGRCCVHEDIAQLAVSALLIVIAVAYATNLLDIIPLLISVVVARWLLRAAFKKHECAQTLKKA